jgi:hypothetical protein
MTGELERLWMEAVLPDVKYDPGICIEEQEEYEESQSG